jgi:hypothetical protein
MTLRIIDFADYESITHSGAHHSKKEDTEGIRELSPL